MEDDENEDEEGGRRRRGDEITMGGVCGGITLTRWLMLNNI